MLEATTAIIAIIAIISLLLGFALGWWLQTRNTLKQTDKIAQLDGELQSTREAKTIAETNLANLQSKFEEEKARLAQIQTQMENTFKSLAADIASKNTSDFLQQASTQFKALKEQSEQKLDEKKHLIDQNLSAMSAKLGDIHKQSTELRSSIDTSQKTTQALSENTAQLREILSSSQKRGQWGERMVEDILQVIGLLENVNYTKQSQVASGQRPDFTFLLPQQKKLNMDVKFPLAHYENYVAADSEIVQAQEKKAFLNDVKKHISDVCGREYINPADGTLEYVMLFIPNEAIYGFIHREDSKLVDEALKNRVLLCSPLTLYAMLSLIHQATQNFIMNERASEVMELVSQFRNQWKKYVEQMDKLKRRIDGLTGDYNELVNTRSRALEKPLDKIENLSLTTTPSDDAEADAPDAPDDPNARLLD